MDIFCYIVSVLLCAGGIAGCFLPVIPGPPLAMAGYLILLFTPASAGMHWITVLVLGVLTLLTVVSDYIIPVLGVRWFGGTPYGRKGSMLGTLVGLFFMPWGLILGPFIGAFIGEIYGKADMRSAFQSGVGSLVGFLCGTFFKVAVTLAITIYVLLTIF
ncbi:MAG: DUF456 domain-containing protein [Muribaculum sp.]|nr:DUF456 domain-containing protein [Muribaculum sp.]